ncbi:hypothetical protein Ciccas_009289 [Cichlidogyrus casuarinus]|uniref:Cyclic nucleotide-binding domain-containing protein n=1 Tax=Cichlidogyrus casuarinus TaxID=1844966 RepID=A0ABD2PYW0_9PLAT
MIPQSTANEDKDKDDKKELDRSKFGIKVGSIPAGRSFGELALINDDCIRNASIISDEICDLVVVDRELYDRSLKSFQEAELKERKDFIQDCQLFSKWSKSHKRQAAMSLRRETFEYDEYLIEQGKSLNGLVFILSGQAKVVIDCLMHRKQYPDRDLDVDPDQVLCLNEERIGCKSAQLIRKNNNESFSRSKSAKSKQETLKMKLGMKPIKRLGYLYIEKRNHLRNLEIAFVGESEIFGIFEYGLHLSTYSQSVICTEKCECFILDKSNFERLAFSKKNIGVQKMFTDLAEMSAINRMMKSLDSKIPLIRAVALKAMAEHQKELQRNKRAHILQGRELDFLQNSGGLQNLIKSEEARKHRERLEKKAKKAMGTRIRLAISNVPVVRLNGEITQIVADNIETESSAAAIEKIYDWETSSLHLNNLENRIHFWHEAVQDENKHVKCQRDGGGVQTNALASLLNVSLSAVVKTEKEEVLTTVSAPTVSKARNKRDKMRIIKLKRFMEETAQGPIVPGKRVYLRPRKVDTSFSLPAGHFGTDTVQSEYSHVSPPGKSPAAFITSIPTTLLVQNNNKEKECIPEENKSKRTKDKKKRNYNLEEYMHLKQELRRKETQMMHFRASLAT